MADNPNPNKGWWQRMWSWPRSRWLLFIPAGGFVMFLVGILFWGGFHTAMEMTNTEKFCAYTCHEMETFVAPEWKDSPHYANASGVRAICSDCHVPEEWGPKVVRKIVATKELYYHLTGKISTREKFEAHRAEMARRVWASMQATDSRECRNCHAAQYFELAAQPEEAARGHRKGLDEGLTCIDCHKGIAHRLPEEISEEELQPASVSAADHANTREIASN